MSKAKISRWSRLLSMLVDHIAMSLIITVILAPILMYSVKPPTSLYFFIIAFSLYLCKDLIGGQSIGKRLLGFKLVNVNNSHPPSEFQSIIRNFFVVLWPLEVIVILVSSNRRIGDFVARTKVVRAETVSKNTNIWRIVLAYIFTVAFLFSLFFLFLNSHLSNYYEKF